MLATFLIVVTLDNIDGLLPAFIEAIIAAAVASWWSSSRETAASAVETRPPA